MLKYLPLLAALLLTGCAAPTKSDGTPIDWGGLQSGVDQLNRSTSQAVQDTRPLTTHCSTFYGRTTCTTY